MSLFKIGITGGIMTGKSTIARMLGDTYDIPVISGDVIAKECFVPNSVGFDKIVDIFGSDILNINGEINKRKFEKLILQSPSCRNELNNVISSCVMYNVIELLNEYEGMDEPYVIYDAPLLYESGMEEVMDYIIIVSASFETQIERMMKRNRLSREEAIMRLDIHIPADELCDNAHNKIIKNEHSITYLNDMIGDVWKDILNKSSDKYEN
jgi:dephospho-CoA kinase